MSGEQRFLIPSAEDVVENVWLVNMTSRRTHKVLHRYRDDTEERVIISDGLGGVADVSLSEVLASLLVVRNAD